MLLTQCLRFFCNNSCSFFLLLKKKILLFGDTINFDDLIFHNRLTK